MGVRSWFGPCVLAAKVPLHAFISVPLRPVGASLLAIILAFGPVLSSGQTAAGQTASGQPAPAASQSQPTKSLGDSLRRPGGKELHILYVHGIGSDGPGDYDSWLLRRGICKFLRDCTTPAGEIDGKREYADQQEFRLDAPAPTLKYLGQDVWTSSQEWNAAAPFVVHWKLTRPGGLAIYVHEINWWPLIFSLKCRQMVRSDASLVGPSAASIKACSARKPDLSVPGRFTSYDWIPAQERAGLLTLPARGALVNRKLKNGLLDWGFSDAVLALGPLRTLVLDGIRQLIMKSVDLSPGPREGLASPGDNQEYVIVSHSLGSYLIFSALDINPVMPKTPTDQRSGDAFEQVLGRTSLVYFFANQLRLLEFASLDGASDTNLITHLEAWGRLRCDYLKSLPGPAQTCVRPQIVAFNDPSDLLTWEVPDIATIEVHNVLVKNASHWLGLIESPTKAHDHYAKNKNVIEQMLKLSHH